MDGFYQEKRRTIFVHSLAVLCAFSLLFLPGCGRKSCTTPSRVAGPRPSEPPAPPRQKGATEVVEQCLINLDSPRTITHEVGPLETLWRISRMYGVPQQEICAANRIRSDDKISIGQKLIIPNAKTMRHVVALYPNPRWKYIVLHHTATDIGKALQVDRAHHDRGFWNGLGYHFLIDNGTLGKGDGQIEVAPRWIKQQTGAHCKAGGMNEKAIGIALVGNFSEDCPTPKQIQSLIYLLKTLRDYYKIDGRHVLGHRDVDSASTECPGRRFPWTVIRQSFQTQGRGR
jgi:N-acetyl-anhydromuramyl-L-alanine amidase AmpD